MIHKLQLKDLFIGKTDAKNELTENTYQERERFFDSFLIPENIIISEFYEGKKYFTVGLKGTGKTALLRYLSIAVEQKYKATTKFILFKTEFSDEDKSLFARAANTIAVLKNEDSEVDEDFVNTWLWFLHRVIVKTIISKEAKPFENDINFEKYSKCILAPKLGNEESGIVRLLPKLKKGNVEIEGDVEFLKGKLGFEFEWENSTNTQVKFSTIVSQANELFKKLTATGEKLFLFIDELELTLGKSKQYNRDIKLIRDLIIAVDKLNNTARQNQLPIYVIAAIRTEVLNSVQSAGKEINKPILDFGVTLKWQQSGGNIKDHPLIKIINKKIQAAERSLKLDKVSSDDEIWEKYFPETIWNKPAPEYILYRTWYRPRDIVRLLSIAQQQFPNEVSFTHQVFDAIVKEYSSQSWNEHVEELRTNLTEVEISGIKKLLTSLVCPFNLNEFALTCDNKKLYYKEVEELLSRHKIGDILSLLYKVGIIGNTGQRVRYSFRGDDELVIESYMKVHDPLWSFFSIEPKQDALWNKKF